MQTFYSKATTMHWSLLSSGSIPSPRLAWAAGMSKGLAEGMPQAADALWHYRLQESEHPTGPRSNVSMLSVHTEGSVRIQFLCTTRTWENFLGQDVRPGRTLRLNKNTIVQGAGVLTCNEDLTHYLTSDSWQPQDTAVSLFQKGG